VGRFVRRNQSSVSDFALQGMMRTPFSLSVHITLSTALAGMENENDKIRDKIDKDQGIHN